jgi:lysophospholipase L1-like esterase
LCLSLILNGYFVIRHGLFTKRFKIQDHLRSVAYVNHVKILASLPVTHKSIIFIGDSQTQGYNVAEFFGNADCLNRGIAGDKSKDILTRLNFISTPVSKLFLQVGINDIMQSVPLIDFSSNVEHIISKLKNLSPGTPIYLENIFPANNASTEEIAAFNNELIAISKKDSLTFIDVYSKFVLSNKLNKQYDCGDGLHLNYNGYKYLTAILVPYVRQ